VTRDMNRQFSKPTKMEVSKHSSFHLNKRVRLTFKELL